MSDGTEARISEGTLGDRLDRLAHTPSLLVATDYDGTLAPIVEDPSRALPERESMVALRMLADQPSTHVAVISGRALSDLAALTQLPHTVHLVGSHGSEFDAGFTHSLDEAQRALHGRVRSELESVASGHEGFLIEVKPASVAFHYRNAPNALAQDALARIERGPASLEGVQVKRGKQVVELSVIASDKGRALDALRQQLGAHAVLFLGDDVTDEDAFATLRGPDVGVKVGEGESRAEFRIADTREVARVLGRMAELRAAWLVGEETTPIQAHSMLSDMRTCALVTPDARVNYLCVPRIDSPAIFCELLGGPSAGRFSISPEDGSPAVSQRYRDGTMVVETTFPTFRVVDFMDCSSDLPRQRAGRTDLVRMLEGSGRVVVEFAPRLDFGRMPTRLTLRDGGVEVEESVDPLVLRAPGVEWELVQEGMHQTARAVIDLDRGPARMSMRYGSGTMRASLREAAERLSITEDFWKGWAERLRPPSTARELSLRSALLLKALVHGPTGAIAAAATTSLPETIGGVRNWDYRFCWPRDGAIAAAALVKMGSDAEAMSLLDWLQGVVERCESPERLHPMYAVTGEELGIEGEISELAGYAGSRPVRVGNAAARQVQLDVFGPIVELAFELAQRDAPLSPQHWRTVEAMVRAVEARWREPDHGIWEIRGPRQHHIHSKVMCWVTVDRAIRASGLLRDREPEGWVRLRDEIAQDVLERGLCRETGAYTASYDNRDADAASLVIGLSGLLPPDDERFARTITLVESRLLRGAGVYRYLYEDGLPGFEGVFNLCTSWLIRSYILVDRLEDARALFERYAALAGPTGLMSEEHGAHTGRALGNVPQAYTHAGLIECAFALDEASG